MVRICRFWVQAVDTRGVVCICSRVLGIVNKVAKDCSGHGTGTCVAKLSSSRVIAYM